MTAHPLAPLPLFNPAHAAHARDPATSFKAAEAAGGLASEHYRLIVDFLDGIHPRAATYEQIADGTKLEKHKIGRRLKELGPIDEGGSGHLEHVGAAKLKSGRDGRLWRTVPWWNIP